MLHVEMSIHRQQFGILHVNEYLSNKIVLTILLNPCKQAHIINIFNDFAHDIV